MANTLLFSAAKPTPTRNAFWVLRTAAALAVIAIWLAVLLHLAMRVRAEISLGQIVREANAFAELPDVRAAELRAFVERRTERAGWTQTTVQIASTDGGYRVTRLTIPTVGAMPKFLRQFLLRSRTATRSVIAFSESRTAWRSG